MDKRIERLIRQVIQEQPALVGFQQAQKLKQPGTMLGYGSRGDLVKNLQKQINDCRLGININVDGIFGVQTLIGLMKANKGTSEKIDSKLIPDLCKAKPAQTAQTPATPTAQSGEPLNLQSADNTPRKNFTLSLRPDKAFMEYNQQTGKGVIYLTQIGGGRAYSTNCQLISKNKAWQIREGKYENFDNELKNKLMQQFCKGA